MHAIRLLFTFSSLLFTFSVALADKPAAKSEIQYRDDDKIHGNFVAKLGKLAEKGECAFGEELAKAAKTDKTMKWEFAKPGDKTLSAEELAEALEPSVFILGSVIGNKALGFEEGRMATAWVLGADGVLMTNWHVFEEIADDEYFGVMNHAGDVFALTELLAVDKTTDVAVFRINAKNLKPLPLAEKAAKVGSWVGVLGHPGDRYYTFTQGHVTRYSKFKDEDGHETRWMSITADYASGSSGSPVLNPSGSVVGMATLTDNIDYPADAPAPAPAKRKKALRKKDDEKKKEPVVVEAVPSVIQMVIKMTIPVQELRAILSGK